MLAVTNPAIRLPYSQNWEVIIEKNNKFMFQYGNHIKLMLLHVVIVDDDSVAT